jgi:hypothetical protein
LAAVDAEITIEWPSVSADAAFPSSKEKENMVKKEGSAK